MASMAAISLVADDLLDREVSDKAIATIAKSIRLCLGESVVVVF